MFKITKISSIAVLLILFSSMSYAAKLSCSGLLSSVESSFPIVATAESKLYDPVAFNAAKRGAKAETMAARHKDALNTVRENDLSSVSRFSISDRFSQKGAFNRSQAAQVKDIIERLNIKDDAERLWDFVLNQDAKIEDTPDANVSVRGTNNVVIVGQNNVVFNKKIVKPVALDDQLLLGAILLQFDTKSDPDFKKRFKFIRQKLLPSLLKVIKPLSILLVNSDPEIREKTSKILHTMMYGHMNLIKHVVDRAPQETLLFDVIDSLLGEYARRINDGDEIWRASDLVGLMLVTIDAMEDRVKFEEELLNLNNNFATLDKMANISPDFRPILSRLKDLRQKNAEHSDIKDTLDLLAQGSIPSTPKLKETVEFIFQHRNKEDFLQKLTEAFTNNPIMMDADAVESLAGSNEDFEKFLDDLAELLL